MRPHLYAATLVIASTGAVGLLAGTASAAGQGQAGFPTEVKVSQKAGQSYQVVCGESQLETFRKSGTWVAQCQIARLPSGPTGVSPDSRDEAIRSDSPKLPSVTPW
jgi:hypothetical protein